MVIAIAGDYIFNLGLYFCRTATYLEREKDGKGMVFVWCEEIIMIC